MNVSDEQFEEDMRALGIDSDALPEAPQGLTSSDLGKISIAADWLAQAAYLTLNNGAITDTREVRPGVMVDLDRFGRVVGVEFLKVECAHAPTDLADLIAEVEWLRAQVERVRELHKPGEPHGIAGGGTVRECTNAPCADSMDWHWPCATIQALEG